MDLFGPIQHGVGPAGIDEAVGTGYLQFFLIPEDEVVIILVIQIEVASLPRTSPARWPMASLLKSW